MTNVNKRGTVRKPIEVWLSCKHHYDWQAPAPLICDLVYCWHCAEYRIVVNTADAFIFECVTCGFRHSYGHRSYAANKAMVKHHNELPEHLVRIVHGEDYIYLSEDAVESTLPLFGIDKPNV